MGAVQSLFVKKEKEMRILMVGLDSAGKTSILYRLKLGKLPTTVVPTHLDRGPRFGVEVVQYKDTYFTLWDVSGIEANRPLWKHYFQNAQGLIFVVDANDRDRIEEVRRELNKLLNDEELNGVVFLVFANKQDLPNAMDVEEIRDKLGLYDINGRSCYIKPLCTLSGVGLSEGLDCLVNELKQNKVR